MMRLASAASLALRLAKRLAFTLSTLAASLVVIRYLLIPALLFFNPSLDSTIYDLGFYGPFPQRYYKSFHLPSPDARPVVWDSSACDEQNTNGPLVSLDLRGSWSKNEGPMLLDLKGNLVWRNTSYGDYAMNVKVQSWRGESYLTFWAGANEKGNFYLLDSGFDLVRNLSVVGEGLFGDPHEFHITSEGTAVVLVYNLTTCDVTGTDLPASSTGVIDGIIQELDIETGELLFQWRASDHLRPEDGEYLRSTYEAAPHCPSGGCFSRSSASIDYYHFNSVAKDSAGNYLLSVRYTHQILCISGTTGEILWGLGGKSTDFEDLSDGEATSFKWQHDARWIDEGSGLLGLFDNGVMHRYTDTAPFSRGMILHLDVENRTAKHIHSYTSSKQIRSLTQGSFQTIPGPPIPSSKDTHSPAYAFIGWGSAGAYTLHSAPTTKPLCETHFVPAIFHSFCPAESYRTYLTPASWSARPTSWDPNAVIIGDAVYVSWNGGMEVRWWILQKATPPGLSLETQTWMDVVSVERVGFEEKIAVPKRKEESGLKIMRYRVAAVDGEGNILRYSNTVTQDRGSRAGVLWFCVGAATPAILFTGWIFVRRKWWSSRLRNTSAKKKIRETVEYAELLPFK